MQYISNTSPTIYSCETGTLKEKKLIQNHSSKKEIFQETHKIHVF